MLLLPDEIKNHPYWCVRKKKVPYNPLSGHKAEPNNKATFAPYEKAAAVVDQYDGFGVLLVEGLSAIDIDHCIVEGSISPRALEVIEEADSYTEVSPSGEGIRILFRSNPAFQYQDKRYYIKNSELGLEFYISGSTNRYVTVTGQQLPQSGIFRELSDQEINALLERHMLRKKAREEREPASSSGESILLEHEILTKAEKSKNGPLFSALWRGDISGYNSQSEADLALCNILAFWCGRDAAMMDSLFRQSALYRPKWDEKRGADTYGEITVNAAISASRDVYKKQPVIKAKVNESYQEKLHDLNAFKDYSWNDKGTSQLFADLHKDKARFNVTAKEWYVYDGKVWRPDLEAMEVSRLLKYLTDQLFIYSTAIEEEEKKADYQAYIGKLNGKNFRNTIIADARDGYYFKKEDFDRNRFLFNCQNGTYDLASFSFRSHDPKDMLSKLSNVEYDPDAKCPHFERFFREVMSNDKEKMDYLQKALGYALTGDTSEEVLFILYGASTRNGKSTLVETIIHMMGGTQGYAMQMNPETLAQKQNKDSRQQSGDVARLDGCRFLNASEPPKRMLLDTALLKTLTGRDTITARFIHEREFQFVPCFKLFINTNHLPLITDDTLFSSGRVNVVSFDRHFSPEEQDRGLKDRLIEPGEIAGIFNWCLEGLRRYYTEGLRPPASVQASTGEYRANSDKVGNFLSECMEKAPGYRVRGKIVYDCYADWCKANGYGVEGRNNFYADLKSKGLFKEMVWVDGSNMRSAVLDYSLPSRTCQME